MLTGCDDTWVHGMGGGKPLFLCDKCKYRQMDVKIPNVTKVSIRIEIKTYLKTYCGPFQAVTILPK